ncbi:hypothetical protein CUMW_198960 [Citrus unshiu]|nr:hypothetical protein CUMW_198960 [Citrus unshiu]
MNLVRFDLGLHFQSDWVEFSDLIGCNPNQNPNNLNQNPIYPLPMGVLLQGLSAGSKIIFTTRSVDVCDQMDAEKIRGFVFVT